MWNSLKHLFGCSQVVTVDQLNQLFRKQDAACYELERHQYFHYSTLRITSAAETKNFYFIHRSNDFIHKWKKLVRLKMAFEDAGGKYFDFLTPQQYARYILRKDIEYGPWQ